MPNLIYAGLPVPKRIARKIMAAGNLLRWLAHQINTHPRASAGMIVGRLCLWFFTFMWGLHTLIEDNALRHPVYKALHLQTHENVIGAISMTIGAIQLWRIVTHQGTYFFGFLANVTALFWYAYLISAMFVFVPLSGPVFSASMTLMCVISIVSLWNDPWLTIKTYSLPT